ASWLVWAQLAAGMAIFGSATPMSKIVTEAFPVFLASGLRMLLSAAILLPIVFAMKTPVRDFEKRDWGVLAAIALVGMFGFTVFLLFGMKMVSGVTGSIVMSTAPAVTAALSFLFFKDRLGWRKSAGIALAVAGVLLLKVTGTQDESGGGSPLLGTLLVFLAVCSEAGYTLFGKLSTERLTPYAIAGLSAALAVPVFLPFAVWDAAGFDFAKPDLGDWIALVWWGAGTMVLGSVLWYSGVAKVEGSTAAGFMGVMPASALILSYVLLGEPFRWAQLAGFAIVFAGVCVIAWAHARPREADSGAGG
ncbi:MAG: DMT family transporter, partial [Bauldia litoralis]